MRNTLYIAILASMVLYVACSPAKGNRTGHEFMPDMVHPTAYEANLYDHYSFIQWGTEEEYKQYASPRQHVNGTVPRGQINAAYAGTEADATQAFDLFTGKEDGTFAYTPNGRVPYYYSDTEEERLRATREITSNPFPITAEGLVHGKEMYDIYCGICHGETGNGLGYLVREEDPAKNITAGVYPAAPANLLLDTFVVSTPGRFYHAIMYGKNVMGSYADKLSYRERWEVIHYIRSLQAKERKLEYSPSANTLNSEAKPWAVVEAQMPKEKPVQPAAPADAANGDDHGQQNNH